MTSQAAYGLDAGRIAIVPQGADDGFRPVEDEAVLRADADRAARRGPAVRRLRRQALAAAEHPDAGPRLRSTREGRAGAAAQAAALRAEPPQPAARGARARARGRGPRRPDRRAARSNTTTSRASTAPPTPTSARRPTRASRSPWSRRWPAGRRSIGINRAAFGEIVERRRASDRRADGRGLWRARSEEVLGRPRAFARTCANEGSSERSAFRWEDNAAATL